MPKVRVKLPPSDRALLPGARAGKPVDPEGRNTALVEAEKDAGYPPSPSRAQSSGASRTVWGGARRYRNGSCVHQGTRTSRPSRERCKANRRAGRGYEGCLGGDASRSESCGHHFRMRQGHLSVSQGLAGILTGVFGLDNRRAADPRYNMKPAPGLTCLAADPVRPPTTLRRVMRVRLAVNELHRLET
jgi:hypothetical protein